MKFWDRALALLQVDLFNMAVIGGNLALGILGFVYQWPHFTQDSNVDITSMTSFLGPFLMYQKTDCMKQV